MRRNLENTAYLSLGSNLGDRVANLAAAAEYIDSLGRIVAISRLYETEPVEFTKQPWFLNCVVALSTDLPPHDLLRATSAIEREMGRVRIQPKGPRTIDIDILQYGNDVIETPELKIPHPALHERRFVLVPMVEIAPEVEHAVLKKSMRKLHALLPQEGAAVRPFLGSIPSILTPRGMQKSNVT